MRPVLQVDLRNYGLSNALKAMTIISKPCYDQSPVQVSIDFFFNAPVLISIPKMPQRINDEINKAIHESANVEAVLGSWSYLELHTSGIHILDTVTNVSLLAYKHLVLDENNIVLIRIIGANDLAFW